MKSDFIRPILVLAVICIVVSGALAVLYNATYPVIALRASERTQAARIEMIPQATGFERIQPGNLPGTITAVYRTANDVGYIFIVTVVGYNGDIEFICAVGPDGNIIDTGVLSHAETPVLGTVAFEYAFASQFVGRNNTDNTLDDIDTITGSTITANAYINAVQYALDAYDIVRGA